MVSFIWSQPLSDLNAECQRTDGSRGLWCSPNLPGIGPVYRPFSLVERGCSREARSVPELVVPPALRGRLVEVDDLGSVAEGRTAHCTVSSSSPPQRAEESFVVDDLGPAAEGETAHRTASSSLSSQQAVKSRVGVAWRPPVGGGRRRTERRHRLRSPLRLRSPW